MCKRKWLIKCRNRKSFFWFLIAVQIQKLNRILKKQLLSYWRQSGCLINDMSFLKVRSSIFQDNVGVRSLFLVLREKSEVIECHKKVQYRNISLQQSDALHQKIHFKTQELILPHQVHLFLCLLSSPELLTLPFYYVMTIVVTNFCSVVWHQFRPNVSFPYRGLWNYQSFFFHDLWLNMPDFLPFSAVTEIMLSMVLRKCTLLGNHRVFHTRIYCLHQDCLWRGEIRTVV